MEVKENIYPILPTAPPIEDQGQGYQLQKKKKKEKTTKFKSF